MSDLFNSDPKLDNQNFGYVSMLSNFRGLFIYSSMLKEKINDNRAFILESHRYRMCNKDLRKLLNCNSCTIVNKTCKV